MPADTIIADILRPDVDDAGAPVANIGEQTDGLGFGADTSVWGNGDGFISVPNAPSSAGAAQAIIEQDGHVKRATTTRDQRWVTKAGTLAPGDRAIVSNCDAHFVLKQATNKIQLKNGAMTVTLDGVTGIVTIDGASTIQIGDNSPLIRIGGASAQFVALSNLVSAELTKIGVVLGQVAAFINGLAPGTVTGYAQGTVAATKTKAV